MQPYWKRPLKPPPAPVIPTHCAHCGGELLIVRHGLFCEHRCEQSRPLPLPIDNYDRRRPDLVVVTQPVSVFAKAIREAEEQR